MRGAGQVTTSGVAIAAACLCFAIVAIAASAPTMIHVRDAKFSPDRAEVAPAGTVIVMSFADKDGALVAHTLTADDGSFEVRLAAPRNATDFTQANFTAPAQAGEHAFHDAASSARGTLVVVGNGAPSSPPHPVPGAPVLASLLVALLLAEGLIRGRAGRHGRP